MKKILVAVVTVFTFTFVSAQEETQPQEFGFLQKDIFVEGNIGFSGSKNTDSDVTGDIGERKYNTFNFTPKVGYFVTDELAVGIRLNLGNSKSEYTQFGSPNVVNETKVNSYGGGLFARYYFLELGKRFKTYSELGVSYSSIKSEISESGNPILNSDREIKSFNAGLDLGIQYFVTSRMAINFALSNVLNFNSSTSKEKIAQTESKSTGFYSNLNSFTNFFDTPTFGLTYKL
ncbi:hypothetical protein GOQ30_14770 [Flavobacterium sp. TP390]|uniref:Outer membrane porin F N-terminal domain-containing protein n=1 Tax=Flavobacterium profundi TaxID=1774945 RepID=A0A6I4IUF2_9FLAO|nr:OmpW family outer membrane protein [Flavobacterium profundi]MVO10435.1 hypothetical protein [Flavobacterium profundi]